MSGGPVLRAVLVAAIAPLALGAAAAPAGADVAGGCTVTINGVDVRTAHSPGRAIEVDKGDVVRVVGTAPGPIDSYTVDMRYGLFRYRAKSGEPTGDGTTWTGSVQVSDYTRYGVGIYRVEGASTGTVCSGWAYLKVNGPFPLATASGGAGALMAAGGVAGMVSAARGARRGGGGSSGGDEARGRKGRRGRGSLFGLLAGLGGAVLLQQFAVVPMTPAVMVGVPVGTALVGLALGWPKAAAIAAAA